MSAALGLDALMQAHPDAEGEALQTLVQSRHFSPVPRINAIVVRFALALVEALEEDENSLLDESWARKDASGTVQLLPKFAVHLSVRCNDTGIQGDAQYWLGVSNDYVARYPLFGGASAAMACLHWTKPPRKLSPLATGMVMDGAVLMLQSRYDGATPVEGAMATLAALPNARMIVVEDEYAHGLFPYGTECVDAQVADYFLQGRLPLRTSSCAGKPLPGEAGA